MKQTLTSFAGIALLAAAMPLGLMAKKGAPHSLVAEPNYSTINLSWKAPDAPKQLLRHNGKDYDGDAGRVTTTQHPAVIYIAADFPATDLTPGDVITSLDYFEYRPVVGLTALIYEDGKLVRQQPGDLSGYKANQWRTVAFEQPYTIPEGKDIRIGFRIDHGSNLDFVAIMDNACDSRGDLRSYDGRTWEHNGRGTYLITANLRNDVDEAPTGYTVYAGDALVADNLQATSLSIGNQPDGTRDYRVEAEYGSARYGVSKTATTLAPKNFIPAPRHVRGYQGGANTADVEWQSPLFRTDDNLLRWISMSDTLANSIGGTASSNTKVWVRNEFAASDLLSFDGAQLTGIRTQFHEKTAQSIIAWVMVDGVIVQHDTVPKSVIDGIATDQWVTFPLSQPVTIRAGHSLAYGYYMIHTPKTHPVSVAGGNPCGSKDNSFSTSSPNSKDFAASKPSWKTLASGNIPGHWMMVAELAPASADTRTLTGYNVYYNDSPIPTTYPADRQNGGWVVPNRGKYKIGVQALSGDLKSDIIYTTVDVEDDHYCFTPSIVDAAFNDTTKEVSFGMTINRMIKHYGEATYKAGFDEEMTLNWGARFSQSDLDNLLSWRINKLNFIIGDKVPAGFSLQVHKADGTLLGSYDIGADQVSPLGFYSLTLDDNKEIYINPEDGLILSYKATLPADCKALVLDAGPLKTDGAIVKLPGLSTWLNLGAVNATYNNYNIVIGAEALPPLLSGAPAQSREIGSIGTAENLVPVELKASELKSGFGIEADRACSMAQAKGTTINYPLFTRFNVYRNGEKIAETREGKFSETLTRNDAFTYQVSAQYQDTWESPLSNPLVVANDISQLAPAPYNLRFGDNFNLVWEAPEDAPVLSYCTADPTSYGVGMTGGTTRTTYAVQKFPADSLAANVGNSISHVRFGLYSTNLTYASVVILKDLNIIYEQPVPVADLKKIQEGWNQVRLNEPVELQAGHDYMIGYRIDYPTGEKPMLFDAGPADDNLGNLMSASASHTSWKSLKSLNSSLDGNWRIYATLKHPDIYGGLTAPRNTEGLTYNVYRDGSKVLEGLTTTTAKPEKHFGDNVFTVTAVRNGVESAHSNEATFFGAVDGITATAAIYYDAATRTLVTDCAGTVYDAAGRALLPIPAADTSVAALPAGTYIFRAADGRTLKFQR